MKTFRERFKASFVDWVEMLKGIFKAVLIIYICVEVGQYFWGSCLTNSCYRLESFIQGDGVEFAKMVALELVAVGLVSLALAILAPIVRILILLVGSLFALGQICLMVGAYLVMLSLALFLIYAIYKYFGFIWGTIITIFLMLNGRKVVRSSGGSLGGRLISYREPDWDREHENYLNQQKSIQQREAAEQARRNEPSPWD